MDEIPLTRGLKRKQYFQSSGFKAARSTISNIKKRLFESPPSSTLPYTAPNSSRPVQFTSPKQLLENENVHMDFESPHPRMDFGDEPKEDKLIYEGAKISETEAMLILVGFMAKHKLTRESSTSLLELINFFLPSGVVINDSLYNLKKNLPSTSNVTSTHYYCSGCENYLGISEYSGDIVCSNCSVTTTEKSLTKLGNYFLCFDLKPQLEGLLRNSKLADQVFSAISTRSSELATEYSDIMDGSAYKNLGLVHSDLSCTINTDGIPVYKSSKFSIWPILVSLNELGSKDRYRHTLIAALWFGHKKPNFDVFFEPFAEACKKNSTTQLIKWNSNSQAIESRVFFPLCVADSVARCLCQGTNQFNGAFGCSWCLTKGESLCLGGRSKKWVYAPGCKMQLRNKNSHIVHLRSLSDMFGGQDVSAKHCFGVKSASKLLTVPKFNIIDGFVFDVMHAAFLGVSRNFTNIWLDSKYHDRDFYIGLKVKHINDQLKNYSVPKYFSRTFRSIEERMYWKASEWRNWSFIVAFVLENILPNSYILHFLKFVKAIMLLTSQTISQVDTDIAEILLKEFGEGVLNLYGKEFCSFNCHSLLHAAQCVRNWGPLFGYSAFQFENFNGVILNYFNGTHKIDIQISNRLNELLCSLQLWYEMKRTLPVEYFLRIVRNIKFRKKCLKLNSVLLFGASRLYLLNRQERSLLVESGFECKIVKCFNTCFVNSLMYSIQGQEICKRSDNVAEVNGDIFLIRKIFMANPTTCLCFASKLVVKCVHNLSPYCYKILRVTESVCLISVINLRSKFICCRSSANQLISIVKLPNTVESE